MIALLLAEAIVISGAWLVGKWLETGSGTEGAGEVLGAGRVWMILILSQVVLMWRAIIRGARYHVTASVSHDVVRPLSRPDPWKESIGGPGGPRYPLEEGDEYGVAL